MKNKFAILIGVLVVAVLLVNMFTFQVRHDEVAVVTAYFPSFQNSVKKEAGLYLRLPRPLQKVTTYEKRVHLLETKTEEQKLADENNVALAVFVAWRIKDPLAFLNGLETVYKAEQRIEGLTRDSKTIANKYRLNELVNVDSGQVQIPKIEEDMRLALAAELQSDGIEVLQVGLRRIMLPETVTPSVFKRMIGDREKIAQNTLSQGTASAKAIEADATRIRDSMLNHAERYARAERSKGDEAAASQYSVFAANPEFASFLKRLEAIPRMIGAGSTLILSSELLDMPAPALPSQMPVELPRQIETRSTKIE
jgi:regulator of protease activity HflC (stomatin/prohibitin superfamily)